MKNQKIIVGFLFFTFIYFISIFSSCAMPTISKFTVDEVLEEFFKTTDSVTVVWTHDDQSAIDSYNLYYKNHGESDWIQLNTAPISKNLPLYRIEYDSLGDGLWDIGVSALDEVSESEIHSSLDSDAEPSGWYLLWAK